MTTLRLSGGRELKRRRQKRPPYFSGLRVYLDRGYGQRFDDAGEPLRVKDPPTVPRGVLTVELFQRRLRRHNALPPMLTGTDRLLLRWGESGGNGLPNPEAEVRETHYDPLPADLQEMVDDIVSNSPWETLTRRWYRMNITPRQLADEMCIGKTQLYTDWKSSLWYYRGRFEAEDVHE